MIAVEQARQLYSDNDTAHGFDHVLRVYHLALRIALAEGADQEIVAAAALLHDVAHPEAEAQGLCHAEMGAIRTREILDQQGCAPELVARVAQAVAEHRYRSPANNPSSLEARVLFDADKLDAIGAVGVARAFAYAGATGQHLWPVAAPDVRLDLAEVAGGLVAGHTPLHEYHGKLSRIGERLLTATGREMAAERQAFMAGFFERMGQEVEGQR